ncbi:cell division protein FtsX [Synergistales bacterium]|nr:cell division protein FtsX [Synergistales bacterium]GHV57085.1 cell division protein FtsX [Synergistales bacterium]
MGGLKYAFRDSMRLVFRHWGLSMLTIFTAVAVFYLIGASILLVMNTRHVVNALEGELSIQAYLAEDTSPDAVAPAVTMLPNITKVSVITKDDALKSLQERMTGMSGILTLLGDNPLPASLEVWVDRAENVPEAAKRLSAIEGIVDVVYAGGLAEKLAKFSNFAGHFSIAFLLVAITASSVVLFNTIRIAVYSKEEEIGIMLMVGATPTFVALPFVIQGMLLGCAGSFGASVLLWFSYNSIIDRLRELLPFLPFLEKGALVMKLGVILVGAGATVSLIASFIAVEAYTRRAIKPL